jgi:arylsulfatase
MLKNTRLQMLLVLAVGAAAGYGAASGKLNPFRPAQAAPPGTAAADKEDEGACCVDKLSRYQVLAQDESKTDESKGKKPNIVFIMGDDIGWFNIGAYHQGIMAGRTPNLDRLATQGIRFTDYYAEASCTAGRANFITGQLPIRTGMTTVGQAGSKVGLPAAAPTIATALKSMGYATGQFGKNHLGDLNEFLPTVHGFDEFFGYLYHLVGRISPHHRNYPQELKDKIGPRNMLHCWATDKDDDTVQPRWGKIGMQRIEDEGPLAPYPDMSNVPNMHPISEKHKYDMTTFDEVLVKQTCRFMDEAKKAGKPFFIWHNTTRAHVWSFLSKKYGAMMNSKTNFGLEEAGMKQLDDAVGAIMKHLDDIGEADNTLIVFSTDNGAECFTWPDGGNTPFKGTKGMATEGGFRVPCIARWPGKIKPGTVENGLFSGLDWFPTFVAAAGNPNITGELLKGVKLGDRTYKNHLDGYNQLDLLLGKGPSKRRELFYFAGPHLGAVRVDNMKFIFFYQPGGWPGAKITTDMPVLVNLRMDPFERFPNLEGQTSANGAWGYGMEFLGREAWRFPLVQEKVVQLAMTAIDYPPMQDPASFSRPWPAKIDPASVAEEHDRLSPVGAATWQHRLKGRLPLSGPRPGLPDQGSLPHPAGCLRRGIHDQASKNQSSSGNKAGAGRARSDCPSVCRQ